MNIKRVGERASWTENEGEEGESERSSKIDLNPKKKKP